MESASDVAAVQGFLGELFGESSPVLQGAAQRLLGFRQVGGNRQPRGQVVVAAPRADRYFRRLQKLASEKSHS